MTPEFIFYIYSFSRFAYPVTIASFWSVSLQFLGDQECGIPTEIRNAGIPTDIRNEGIPTDIRYVGIPTDQPTYKTHTVKI